MPTRSTLVMCVCALAAVVLGARADAATLRVCASGCTYSGLQAAIDAAAPGDTILLAAGQSFTGPFILRAKGATSAYITIRSDASDGNLPADGVRLVPSTVSGGTTNVAYLAKLVGQGGAYKTTPVVSTAPGANHYILQFLEIDGSAQLGNETVVAFGDDQATTARASDLIVDRVYIHGNKYKGQKRGVSLNCNHAEIRNSYISDIKEIYNDAQGIAGWNGAGPFTIENNYIEAAAENILFGGADPSISNLVPSDIVIRQNTMSKPLTWRNPVLTPPASPAASASSNSGSLSSGTHYFSVVAIFYAGPETGVSLPSEEVSVSLSSSGRSVSLSWSRVTGADKYRIYRGTASGGETRYLETSGDVGSFTYTGAGELSGTPPTKPSYWLTKNLLELKNAQRVTLDGNVMENNWAGAQAGYALQLTPRDQQNTAPWSVVQDVTISNNIVRHAAGGINILGYDTDSTAGSKLTQRITVRNNVFDDIDPATWGGDAKVFLIGQGAAYVTFDSNTIFHNCGSVLYAYGPKTMPSFVYTNNISKHGKYGIMGEGASTGLPTISKFFPGGTFTYNVLAGGSSSLYPPTNVFPTLAQWNASFATGDYSVLSTSVFYSSGPGGGVPGASIATLDAALPGGSTPIGSPPPAVGSVPAADAGGPYSGTPGVSLPVDGTKSTDSGGSIVSYRWWWGEEIVLHAVDFADADLHGRWKKAPVAGAADGIALVNDDLGDAKISTALASPANYVEIRFNAASGVAYRLFFRMSAQGNSYANDSVFAQFSGTVDSNGSPIYRIGTTGAAAIILQEGSSGTIADWGWADANYGGLAAPIYFAQSGPQVLRIQQREDGAQVDQVVISASTYFAQAPGPSYNDTKIVSTTLGTTTGATASHVYAAAGVYPVVLMVTDSNGVSAQDLTTATIAGTPGGPLARSGGPYSGAVGANLAMDGSASTDTTGTITSYQWRFGDEVVLRATDVLAADIHGRWAKVNDSTAAGGVRIENADQGDAKISPALAAPTNYFEASFDAGASAPYRLWIRLKAANNSYTNDSVYVQFDDSTDSSGNPQYRLGTTSAAAVVLQEGTGAVISGWGWNDASYGGLASPIYFANSGRHRIRIQQREDGVSIDQVVLSTNAYMDTRPGTTTNDTRIVPQSLGTAGGVAVAHSYRWAGTYPVTLTVGDSNGRTGSASTTATIK